MLWESRSIILMLVWLVLLGPIEGADRIRALLIGDFTGSTDLEALFKEEPLIEFLSVPCRQGRVKGDLKVQMKYIRQYFPRSYEEMGDFDYIMLITTSYDYLSDKQDRWIHDRIADGAGGFNDQSVLSASHSQIHTAWANSMAQKAFPNDAPAVVAGGLIDYTTGAYYGVVVDRDFPDPVLTPYVPFGVEQHLGYVGRFVIARQSAGVMAYQTGNFIGHDKVPFLVVWDYGEGRTVTCGGALSEEENWFGSHNPYGPDMLINIILYSTRRGLIEDVEVFHRIKGVFRDFGERMELLSSLVEFIDRFGANTDKVSDRMIGLREARQQAENWYLEGSFAESENLMRDASEEFSRVESLAKRVKNGALMWVYIIEWLVTTSVLFLSGFILWTLMIRRSLYKEMGSTRLLGAGE